MAGKIKWEVQNVLDAAEKAVRPSSSAGRNLLAQLKGQASKLGNVIPGRR